MLSLFKQLVALLGFVVCFAFLTVFAVDAYEYELTGECKACVFNYFKQRTKDRSATRVLMPVTAGIITN